MVSILNLFFSLLFPSLIHWWKKSMVIVEPAANLNPADTVKALAALAGILILGIGAVITIGLSGRLVRKLYFGGKLGRTGSNPSEKSYQSEDWSRMKVNRGDFDRPGSGNLEV